MEKYTYSQVLDSSVQYFNGDDFAAKVFVDKYALRNTEGEYLELTPTDMHHRLAKEFARIESKYPNPMSEQEIFDLFDHFRYIVPQGSPMSAIGNPYQIRSAGNCYVVDSPLDSYGSICKSDQELAQLMKRRSGVGIDLSNIRPKGMSTNNSARTTDGIGIFMERFSNTCREVAQNGRRGAELRSLSVKHPEIETFISIKQDKKKVTGANVSVRITDDFMQAVENDADFMLKWPIDSDTPKLTKNVKAKSIWDQLISAAWASAEPGILFWDNIINNSIPDLYAKEHHAFLTQSTNPCQPSWATLLTPNGITLFDNVNIGDIIWSGKKWTKIINKICTGEKDVYAYRTRAGTFYGTENHRVVSGGQKIEVKDAESIDISYCNDIENIKIDEDNNFAQNIIDGLVIGDGMVHQASNNKVVLIIGKNDIDYFNSEISNFIIEDRSGISEGAWSINTTIKYDELPKTYNRKIPDRYKLGDFNTRRSFLRGLYSANGSVVSNRITLKASSFHIIEDVQQMLSSLGIPSYYTINKSHDVKFDNGIYECKQSYDLNIGTLSGRILFNKYIGFIQKYKTEKVLSKLESKNGLGTSKITYDIAEKEYLGKELVYDITVDAEEHTYWTGGLLVSNCGEIMLGLDSCRLTVVNLTAFVKNPFTKNAEFDFIHFHTVTSKAQKLMDDLIDLELELIDKIISKIENDPEPIEVKAIEMNLWKTYRSSCEKGRRTGLGPTGLGDTLAMLNIKYGSEKSIEMTYKIYRALGVAAHTSSCVMAKERGSFPIFDYEKEKDHHYLNKIMNDLDKSISEYWKTYGRRNIALTTTAPCGSVSALTQTTSGIEPAFLLSYVRRKKINPSDKNAKIDFVDALGDTWQEFTVYHYGVKKWMEITGETDISKSPYWGATSTDIDWIASVDLQAAAQKSVDHSISKTCNLPSSVTKETVSEIYMRAWTSGCKGFTIYRDGCRTGVLISEEEAKKNHSDGRPADVLPVMSPKRPPELSCEIKKAKVNGEAWTMFVGLLNGKPYEVFGGLSKYVDIPNKYKTGKIIKSKDSGGNSIYNLSVGDHPDDVMTITDIASIFENKAYEAFTRMISLNLRHGTPIQYIVEQLTKDKYAEMTSFTKVMARVLKKYIKDGTKVSSEKKCPECGNESLIYQEGCLRCSGSCGYSKCN